LVAVYTQQKIVCRLLHTGHFRRLSGDGSMLPMWVSALATILGALGLAALVTTIVAVWLTHRKTQGRAVQRW